MCQVWLSYLCEKTISIIYSTLCLFLQFFSLFNFYFRALKTKGNTPKYGLIFHSSFIGRASSRNKGRMARYLANKCSIASRIDCFSGMYTNLIYILVNVLLEIDTGIFGPLLSCCVVQISLLSNGPVLFRFCFLFAQVLVHGILSLEPNQEQIARNEHNTGMFIF